VVTVTWRDRMKIWERWYSKLWSDIGPVATLRAVSAQLRSIDSFVASRGARVVTERSPKGVLRQPAKSCYLDLSCHRKLRQRIQEAVWRTPSWQNQKHRTPTDGLEEGDLA